MVLSCDSLPLEDPPPSPFCSFDDVDACHAWLRRLFVHLCPANYRWFYEKMSRRKQVYADFGEREKELSNYRNQNILREQEKKTHLWKTYLTLTRKKHQGRSTQHMIPSFPVSPPYFSSSLALSPSLVPSNSPLRITKIHHRLYQASGDHETPLRFHTDQIQRGIPIPRVTFFGQSRP